MDGALDSAVRADPFARAGPDRAGSSIRAIVGGGAARPIFLFAGPCASFGAPRRTPGVGPRRRSFWREPPSLAGPGGCRARERCGTGVVVVLHLVCRIIARMNLRQGPRPRKPQNTPPRAGYGRRANPCT